MTQLGDGQLRLEAMKMEKGDVVDGGVHQLVFDADAAGKVAEKLNEALNDNEKRLGSQTRIEARIQIVNTQRVGPNKPCPCGSGKKNKKCCRLSPEYKEITHLRMVVLDPDVAKALKRAKRQGKTVRHSRE